jgi:AcrR family transcriptional regulator
MWRAVGPPKSSFFGYFASKEDVLYDNTAERVESAARVIAAHASEAPAPDVLVRAIEEMLADSWTLGLVPGLTGQAVNLPVTLPKAALARSNARVDRLAGALADAFPDELDRITAYALVGAVLGAVSATVAAALGEGHTEEQAVDAATGACRLAVAGFQPARR